MGKTSGSGSDGEEGSGLEHSTRFLKYSSNSGGRPHENGALRAHAL